MRKQYVKDAVLDYFFIYPRSRIRVRQLALAAKSPLPSVIRYCKELCDEGVLEEENVSGVRLYRIPIEHKKFATLKMMNNLSRLYECGLIESLEKIFFIKAIVLFGSYSRGDDNEDSDIDLYIDADPVDNVDLSRFEKMLGRKIQLFVHRKITEIPKELAYNVINGYKLYGQLDGFLEARWMEKLPAGSASKRRKRDR